ncbi:hypothetical protein [Collinsella stercoris]|uniref:Uncharacterized protein n=1 Tax=Collinsella stercoris DSM 13279 TaxID=445975 RepID=B6GAJ4_9ACTN|nr:hypothetical protein [Collinsella stercoris]EEA90706.1 hypothetical protein COLSTE_01094 [Collinsella stercoris DSM 13279]UEA45473.1 hypothetical protein LK434_10190 [Collinsella stercoris DSM 13279]UWP12003.1 hypothetical protein NQ498_01840 [Collinsella stercoris]
MVEIGDALIGDQGFFSFATVPAFMSAVGGSLGNVVRIDLSTYDYVRPVTPFAVFRYWLIGQPGATVSGLKVTVWSRA